METYIEHDMDTATIQGYIGHAAIVFSINDSKAPPKGLYRSIQGNGKENGSHCMILGCGFRADIKPLPPPDIYVFPRYYYSNLQ